MKEYHYYNNCVTWPGCDVETGLRPMIDDAITITRATFLKHVIRADLKRVEAELGYDDHPRKGLTMAGDFHVKYSRSKLHGRRVYFITQSAIEYVFTKTTPTTYTVNGDGNYTLEGAKQAARNVFTTTGAVVSIEQPTERTNNQ